MPFSCELDCGGFIKGTRTHPYRFVTKTEAERFGSIQFEPPQSVERWMVVEVSGKVNAVYEAGRTCFIG